jgi:hypothetical protein
MQHVLVLDILDILLKEQQQQRRLRIISQFVNFEKLNDFCHNSFVSRLLRSNYERNPEWFNKKSVEGATILLLM